MKRSNCVVLGIAALAMAIPAHATLVGTSYQVGEIPFPPPSVLHGQFTNNTFITLFQEQRGLILTKPVTVDAVTQNLIYTSKAQLVSTVIPVGTKINSWYAHADITDTKVKFPSQYISFSQEEILLGLIVQASTLEASSPIVGVPTTQYDTTQTGVGLHFAPTGKDTVQMVPFSTSSPANTVNMNEIVVDITPTDFRIITEIIPVPPSRASNAFLGALAGLALLGAVFSMRSARFQKSR